MSHPRSAPVLAVTALCLVQFVDVLGVTVVVTALPAMLVSLHTSPADSTLAATGYSMFFGGLLVLGARLGDRFGHRRTILAGLAALAVGGVVAATATSACPVPVIRRPGWPGGSVRPWRRPGRSGSRWPVRRGPFRRGPFRRGPLR